MDENYSLRVRRVYAAIDALDEFDMSLLKAQVTEIENRVAIYQDFTGGLTQAQLENLVQSAIYNVAHLRDPLKAFATLTGRREVDVRDTLQASEALRVVVDLANLDKHHEPKFGHSGRSPRLANINRVLRLVAEPGKGVGLTLNRDGTPRIVGGGSAKAVIVADVLDASGAKMGGLGDFLDAAVTAWESLLEGWGVVVMPG